jgi:hypothetical protein
LRKIIGYPKAHGHYVIQHDLMRSTKATLSDIGECIDAGVVGTEIVNHFGPGRGIIYVFLIGGNCVTDGIAEKAHNNRQILLSAKTVSGRRDSSPERPAPA